MRCSPQQALAALAEIDRCLRCSGTWLDAGEIDQLARLRGGAPDRLSVAIAQADAGKKGERRCVRCSAKMRVVTLEKGHNVQIAGGPRLTVHGDSDQLEQLLINLVRNAIDAVRETNGGVRVGWQRLPGSSPARR